ncbi:MAG: hypothetical protein ACI3XC_06035 [Phascolarctobacterium sp.]
MRKQLMRKITNMVFAASLCLCPAMGQAASGQIEALVAGKFAVVGSIADLSELRSTLAYLESVGMKGAFIVSAREAKQYPENIKLIVKYGHTIILEMQGKQAELRVASGMEKQAPKAASSMAKQAPKADSSMAKQAPRAASIIEKQAPKASEETVQVPPLIIGHTSVEEPSFRERAAKGRAQKEQAELSKAIASPIMEPKTKSNVRERKVDLANPLDFKAEKTAVKEKKDLTDLHNPPEGKPALKSVGTTDTRNLKIERPKLTKKQRVARDFFGMDENGRKVGLRYPGTAKDTANVPEWTLVSLTKLGDFGLLSPTELREILSEPNRELLAKLIARAYHENEENRGKNYYDAQFELEKLMVEYDTELRNLGYDAGRYAAFGGLPKEREAKFGGELRYNYVDHRGDNPYNFFDSRVRLRLYAEQPLDDNWTLYGMGEGNKSWYRDVKHFNLERLYISGQYKEVQLTGGRFGEFYADGNVYDGRIDGAKVSGGSKVKLSAEYGKLRDDQKATALVASYSQPRYDAEAGVYILDKLKSYGSTTIGSLGGMYYIGNFGVGAMYLCSSRTSVTGGAGGYVVTLKYGRNRSWVPGTYEIFAKYYSQPDATYISHTMVGLADYMRGFQGFGVGWYYTLAENIIYGIEYYDLEEKGSGKKGRTLWNHVSLFF